MKKEPAYSPTENRKVLPVPESDAATQAAYMATIYATPSFNTAILQLECNPNSGLHLTACIEEMKTQMQNLQKGDLSRIESMLLGQSHALQAIFTKCATRMTNAEYLNEYKINGALALKAQNQCRQTLATLAGIKNPKRATFIKNSATNQQINVNGSPVPDSQKNIPNLSNELLSESNYATMDNTGAQAASLAHT